MTEEAVAYSAPSPPPAPKTKGLTEWLTRRQALREARALRTQLPVGERLALERALRAQELADRAYEPVDALRSGSSLALSISLYREAAYWGLLAHGVEPRPTLAGVFDAAPRELLEFAAAGPEGLPVTRRALVERSFVDTAALPAELLPADAELSRSFAAALLQRKLEPEKRVGQLLLQRAARCLGLLGLLLAVALTSSAIVGRLRHGPDLAAGKPWKASSSPDICHPAEHRCAGAHTDMFFTTSEEVDPWVEIDLGRPTAFNQIEVKNRSDCCPDRAAPLVVEVSNDAKSWREIAKRQDTFTLWQAGFATQTARYVRLRVPRRTVFHLDKVSIRHVG